MGQEDIVAAAHQSLKNIGAILKEAGMDYNNVVKTTVLLADIADFKAVNEVYAEYFTGSSASRFLMTTRSPSGLIFICLYLHGLMLFVSTLQI